MSHYDGPRFQDERNNPKKFKFPFYTDTDKVTQKEKNDSSNTGNGLKNDVDQKPVKRSRDGKHTAPEAVFSEFLNRTDSYTRVETNKVEMNEQKAFEERKKQIEKRIADKNMVRTSLEEAATPYTDSRSSTPFKVQKIPSPIYGYQREKKVVKSGVDYQKMAELMKKEFDTFLLLATNEEEASWIQLEDDEPSIELMLEPEEAFIDEVTEQEEMNEQEIDEAPLADAVEELTELEPEVEEEMANRRLQRSLQGMIEEEQDIRLNRGTNVARYFGESHEIIEEALKEMTEETIPEVVVEEVEKETEISEAEQERSAVVDESALEYQAALSRLNYLSHQAEKQEVEPDSVLEEPEIVVEEELIEEAPVVVIEQAETFIESTATEDEELLFVSDTVEITEKEVLITEEQSAMRNKVQVQVHSQEALPTMESISDIEERELRQYQMPPLELLNPPVAFTDNVVDDWVLEQAELLNETLDAFGVDAQVIGWTIGPAVTQFELQLGRGVKVNKITNLSDDLKLALAAKDIRIEAPIPGKSSVGVEIPNCSSRPVMLSEVMGSKAFKESKSPLTVALGVNLSGEALVTTIEKMPHGLIAGATGSGKSVFINSILVSLLYKAKPNEVKLILIDPKAVELAPYNDIPHLLSPVISEPKAAAEALKWAVDEMEERYQKLAAAGVRNIERFNEKAEETGEYGLKIPYIVIIIDELADLMMVASNEVQDYIARITQKARAAGIHLLVATQRPSVDVITGTIKNNIPTRVAFMVSSQIDSRTILDIGGAEKLLGRGDMLFMENGSGRPIRIQGTYVEQEIDSVVKHVKDQRGPNYLFEPETLLAKLELVEGQDELFEAILEFIAGEDTVSVSLLQRKFKIGFNRASNLIETLESQNLISGNKGSKPRDVYLTQADYEKNYQ